MTLRVDNGCEFKVASAVQCLFRQWSCLLICSSLTSDQHFKWLMANISFKSLKEYRLFLEEKRKIKATFIDMIPSTTLSNCVHLSFSFVFISFCDKKKRTFFPFSDRIMQSYFGSALAYIRWTINVSFENY